MKRSAPGALAGVLLGVVLPGCAGHIGQMASTADKPPDAWESAVLFRFQDATRDPAAGFHARLEFFDGRQRRVVTGRDLVRWPSGEWATPWYRLWLSPGATAPSTRPLTITLEHANGARTVTEHPLQVFPHVASFVSFRVFTRTNDPFPPMNTLATPYPLAAEARAQPGDSLWVFVRGRGIDCWLCPS